MDALTRTHLVQQLGAAMSDVSEDCYYAGWMEGTENAVPQLCQSAMRTGESQPWGHSEVTPAQATVLLDLAKRAGCWADLDDEGTAYVPYTPPMGEGPV